MVNHSKKQQHVMIVGGGLAGLSAAEWLLRQTPAPRITIVESAHRLGGVIETVAREGWLIERSADSFLFPPWQTKFSGRPTNHCRRYKRRFLFRGPSGP